MSTDVLNLAGVSFGFGSRPVLNGVEIVVRRNEFIAVVGASGCGKTTLLNLMAGVYQPTSGAASREGVVRMVYQDGGLFPWLTAWQNVSLGVRHVRDRNEQHRQVDAMLALVGLTRFAGHYPHQLSGGMRQRVEFARAFAGGTDTLLLDEPFSGLDYLTRMQLRLELVRILQRRPCTVVLITHHLEEAAQLADRVLVLGGNPARIRRQLTMSRPRPRSAACPEIIDAVRVLQEEFDLTPITGKTTA
jgi:NitT/TauT family transport system ATP-binding protein